MSKGKFLDKKRKVKLQGFPKAKHLQIRTKRWKIILYLPNFYQHYQSNAIQFSDTFVTGYVNVCVDKQEPENRGQSGLPGWTMLLQGKVDFLVGSCHCCQAHLMSGWGQCVPSSATSGEQGSTGMTRCRIPAALLQCRGHADMHSHRRTHSFSGVQN